MRPAAISNARRCYTRTWLASLALAALVSGCAASRTACEPGARKNGSGSAAAGRALIGIAEVLVGAELTDHDDEGVDCASATGADRPSPFGTADRIDSSATAPSQQPELKTVAKPSSGTNRSAVASVAARQPAASSPVRSGRWILVRKRDRTLSLYEADRRLKTYYIVLGEDPIRPKLYEGDRRTPEGEYHIIAKHEHPEWQRFLLLDYPNADNLEAYQRGVAEGLLPIRGGKVPGTGGAIGIHGTKDDELNRHGINWTRGCISLISRDIRELYDNIPVGTAVVIER